MQLHGALVGTLSRPAAVRRAVRARPSSRCSRAWRCRPRSRWTDSASPSELETSFLATIDALVRALEAQDMYTSGHALSIADLARRVGRVLGLDPAALRDVEHAAVLHDIGKIGIPSELLRKHGPAQHRGARAHARAPRDRGAHPRAGRAPAAARAARALLARALGRQRLPRRPRGRADPARRAHHLGLRRVRRDGLGSPLPRWAQRREALAELRAHAGTQFDPAVVEAFEQAVRDHRPPASARVGA